MRKLLTAALIAAVPLGGWFAIDTAQAAYYERRCVQGADDIDLCYKGHAAGARRRCDVGVRPPGVPQSIGLSECVQAWLDYEQ